MGEFVGRYRIIETIGEGGMGVVFAAEDTDLRRRVALKMIRNAERGGTDQERMWREARAAAAINHPNVCQVYEVGEHEGDVFLAMELLTGEPLSDRLARNRLKPNEAVAIVQEVLSAVGAAHGQGIVHRDLKPSNVFLTEHGVKLLDFGLALPSNTEGDERLTQPGFLLGTPAFMAPEQWRGETAVPASDIFAVGALAFEMLAGEPPFQGANAVELFHAVVHDQPSALVGGPSIAAIDRVLQRALAKSPDERYASAAEMAGDLAAAQRVADTEELPRARTITRLIAVPFTVVRPNEETEFLSFGLPDAIASSLSELESIVVRSSHVNPGGDYVSIARKANVDFVLAGRILRAGDRLRVSVQLLNATDGSVTWSDNVDAAADDIFQLQDDLARRIVASLSISLTARDERDLARKRAATPDAYRYYLRGNQISNNSGMLDAARDLYLKCVDEDAAFAPAWARLGRTYRVMAKYGHVDAPEGYRLAEEAFRKALTLNPDLSVAHNLFTHFEIEQLCAAPEAMVRLLKQASRYPSDPELYSGLVVACRFCGLLDASVAADRRARRIDPGVRTSVAYTYWARGDYEEAMRHDDEDMRYMYMDSLPMLGRIEEAVALCNELERDRRSGVERDFVRSKRAALQGDAATCVQTAMRVFESRFDDPEGIYHLARDVAYVGDVNQAVRMMEFVVERGLLCVDTFERDPWLDPLRGSPEFKALVARARAGHDAAREEFARGGGERLLSL